VGKGRQIAGVILDNYIRGRRCALRVAARVGSSCALCKAWQQQFWRQLCLLPAAAAHVPKHSQMLASRRFFSRDSGSCGSLFAALVRAVRNQACAAAVTVGRVCCLRYNALYGSGVLTGSTVLHVVAGWNWMESCALLAAQGTTACR
jgi:hypothetical protein